MAAAIRKWWCVTLLLVMLSSMLLAQEKTRNYYYNGHEMEILPDARKAFQNGRYARTVELCTWHYVYFGDQAAKALNEKAERCARLLEEMSGLDAAGNLKEAKKTASLLLSLNPKDAAAREIMAKSEAPVRDTLPVPAPEVIPAKDTVRLEKKDTLVRKEEVIPAEPVTPVETAVPGETVPPVEMAAPATEAVPEKVPVPEAVPVQPADSATVAPASEEAAPEWESPVKEPITIRAKWDVTAPQPVEAEKPARPEARSFEVCLTAFGNVMDRIVYGNYSQNKTGLSFGVGASLLLPVGRFFQLGGGVAFRALPSAYSQSSISNGATVYNVIQGLDRFPFVFADVRASLPSSSRPFLLAQAGTGMYYPVNGDKGQLGSIYASLGVGLHPLKKLSLHLSMDYMKLPEKKVFTPTLHLGLSLGR